MFKSILMLAFAWLSALHGAVASSSDSACGRYLRALENPENLRFLESWLRQAPRKLEKEDLSRGSNRYPGMGGYALPLPTGIDLASLHLNENAEVRVAIRDDGSISSLVLIDTRGVAFYFRIDDNVASFERNTLPAARSKNVGVMCLRDTWEGVGG